MAAFGLLGALGIASLGRAISGPRAGAMAAIMFVLHPVVIVAYTRVGSDIIALGFSIWSSGACWRSCIRSGGAKARPGPDRPGSGFR
jgi:hypothetical protein